MPRCQAAIAEEIPCLAWRYYSDFAGRFWVSPEIRALMTTEKADDHRLDKWLWQARFYKTRSLATAAISGGKVHLNAQRVKPAHRVGIGDRISLNLQGVVAEFEVLGLPLRRGPAPQAHACFL